MNELTPVTVATTFLMMPWHLSNHQAPVDMIIHEPEAHAIYARKVTKVLSEEMDLRRQSCDSMDPATFGPALLSERVFSPKAEQRDDSLRAAFVACLDPDYQELVMTQGTSNYVWVQTRIQCDAATAAGKGNPVAEAMVNMLDTLKQEVPTLCMDMLDDVPAILWEDLLTAVNAPRGRKANALLKQFMEEGYAAQHAGKTYVLFDSLIWTLPQMVVELSLKRREKKHLVDAGYKIFSAILHSHSSVTDAVVKIIRAEVEEGGIGRVQEAMTEARHLLGPAEEPDALEFTVSENLVGHVSVERLHRVKH